MTFLLMTLLVVSSTLAAQEVVFRRRGSETGIDYRNVAGEPEKRHILSTLGSGVALLDYDEDGDLDVYFVNGARLSGGLIEEAATNRLYRNEGGWKFTDVTERAGVGDPHWGFGVAAADFDNDGFTDLYVTNLGPNLLYRNRGDGTFVEVGGVAGVDHGGWGTSAAFFDAEGDGDLDLYVANYVDVDVSSLPQPGRERRCQWFGIDVMCGPKGLPGASDVFYTNLGDGTFADSTEASGMLDPTGAYGLGVASGDVDDDGDPDLYVANDSVPNFLYRNDGKGRFTEVAFLSGVALSGEGQAQAGMGVDLGDVNGDGRLDIFVTNFSHEPNNAYLNHGGGLFLDAVDEANLHGPSWFSLGWGVRLVDFDNDADLDLFVANGHVYPGVDETNLRTRYHQKDHVFWNDGGGRFFEKTLHSEDALNLERASRAAAFGDLDGDGDVDAIVVHIDDAPSLLENRMGKPGQTVAFRVVGRTHARDAIGSRLTLSASGVTQVREVHPSGSFLSSSDRAVSFLPADTLELRWPNGKRAFFRYIERARAFVVLEDVGTVAVPY